LSRALDLRLGSRSLMLVREGTRNAVRCRRPRQVVRKRLIRSGDGHIGLGDDGGRSERDGNDPSIDIAKDADHRF
jgi:hypothetical protein